MPRARNEAQAVRHHGEIGDAENMCGGMRCAIPPCALSPRHARATHGKVKPLPLHVMPGLVPGIHVFSAVTTWMAGTSPAMTNMKIVAHRYVLNSTDRAA